MQFIVEVNSWEFVHVDYLDVRTMDGHQCDGGWFSVNHHLLCLIGVYVQVAEFIPDDEVGDDLPPGCAVYQLADSMDCQMSMQSFDSQPLLIPASPSEVLVGLY